MAKKAKTAGTVAGRGKRRAKAVVKPAEPKVTLTPRDQRPEAGAQPKPAPKPSQPLQTVDADKLEAWRSLPEEQRNALREREAQRMFQLAAGQHRTGDLQEAVRNYGKSLLLNPRQPDVYNNMGVALRALGKREAAVACYRRALALKPNNAGVYSNMGNALRELGRLEVAQASHQQAVRLNPRSTEAYYNLGLVLRDLGQIGAAMSCFDKALALDPEHVDCRWDRALTLLEDGKLKEGFAAYECRWGLERNPPREMTKPMWDGAPVKGKTVLVTCEQGFGDIIQFARYLPMIKTKGANVVVEVQPELARLISGVAGADRVINRGGPLPAHDFYVPMLSLPYVFGTDLDSIPNKVPYISGFDPSAVQLPANLGRIKRIGIAWAGRPTHRNDRNRSAGFKHFVELLGLAGVAFFSLQKGPAATEILEYGCEALVTDLGGRVRDFADSAAVVSQLDLVITVDTALGHLAGALGKPVWIAVPFAPDWRWMRNRTDSPWYPSARLFRQKRPGAWEGVFADIRRTLRDEIAG